MPKKEFCRGRQARLEDACTIWMQWIRSKARALLTRAEKTLFLSPFGEELESLDLVKQVRLLRQNLVAHAQFRRGLKVDLVNVRPQETAASSTPPDAEGHLGRVSLSIERGRFGLLPQPPGPTGRLVGSRRGFAVVPPCGGFLHLPLHQSVHRPPLVAELRFWEGGAGEGCTKPAADVDAPALVAAAKELVRGDAVSMCRPAGVAHGRPPVLGLDWRWGFWRDVGPLVPGIP